MMVPTVDAGSETATKNISVKTKTRTTALHSDIL